MTLVDIDYLWDVLKPLLGGSTYQTVKNVLDTIPKFKTSEEWSEKSITKEGIYLYKDCYNRGYYIVVVKKEELPHNPNCKWIELKPTWWNFFPEGDDWGDSPTVEGIL